MKKLGFLNGSLLLSLLAGGQIVYQAHDGYDFHAITKTPVLAKAEGEADKWTYEYHSTKNYESKSNEFTQQADFDGSKNLRVLRTEFDATVKSEGSFKAKYPRTENIPAEAVG